jgi:hypothetical protein
MQENYISAHEEALAGFDAALESAWRQLSEPREAGSLVLAIMVAKEFTEWGRLLSSIAEASFAQGWSLPELSGTSNVDGKSQYCNMSIERVQASLLCSFLWLMGLRLSQHTVAVITVCCDNPQHLSAGYACLMFACACRWWHCPALAGHVAILDGSRQPRLCKE